MLHRFGWAVIALLFIGVIGCTRDEGKVQITPVIGAASLDRHETVEVDADCTGDSKLIGGGYQIFEPTLSSGNPLIIEASYPVSDTTWRVIATRPPSFDKDQDGVPTVVTAAYCLSVSSGEIDVSVVESGAVTPTPGGAFESATAEATCPDGLLRTAGGFRVRPAADDEWDVAGLYSAWVWETAPSPGGWHVQLHRILGQQGPTPPTFRAVALCLGEPVDQVREVQAAAAKRDPSINYGYLDGSANCNSLEIASGGGFEFGGDPLVPHVTTQSHSSISDGLWLVSGIHGHQVGATGALTVHAVCVEIPRIVDAAILSPRGEVCTNCVTYIEYPVVVETDSNNPSQSEPIDLVGSATDGLANPLTGSALVWTAYGGGGTPISLGTGEMITASLPGPGSAGSIGYIIELVATDADGNEDSDSIAVVVVGG